MEKEKNPIYKKWWFFVIMLIIFIACVGEKTNTSNTMSTNANTTGKETLKIDLNKKNIIGKLTYYTQEDWESKETTEEDTINEFYYLTDDTTLMISLSKDEAFTSDIEPEIYLDSYISGLNLGDNDFINKSAKKINKYNCGIIRYYIHTDNGKYETVVYIIYNNNEAYTFMIGQKDNLDNQYVDLVENIIEKSVIIVEKNKITVIDFSQMSKEDIQVWCNTNKVNCNITESYSDTVEKGMLVSQSVQANNTIYEGDTITITYSLGKEPTLGQRNALSKAKDYLRIMAFSYKGLIEQLEYEGYSTEEATYGTDNCGADWNEQAAKKAKDYINMMSFSKSGLIEQLEYEGFTKEQAQHGATSIGY